MFTWICPKCGREVPPSYDECPDCTAKPAKPLQEAVLDEPEPQPEPEAAAPPPPPEAVPTQYAPPPVEYLPPVAEAAPPARTAAMPSWLLAIVFALAFVGLVGGAYWLVDHFRSHAAPAATVESPAAKPGASTNPFQRYIEVSGIRFTADPKKSGVTMVKFVLTNHSEAGISGLAGNVTIWGRTRTSEEDAQGTFSFKTDLGAFETKEMSAPLNTKFKIYELPDWQNATPDVQITAPGGVYDSSPSPQ
jgi:hypothetical protein